MCEISAVVEPCGSPVPGIAELYIAETKNISAIPAANTTVGDADEWKITTAITMVATKKFKKIDLEYFSASFEDDMKDGLSSGFGKMLKLRLKKYHTKANAWVSNAIGTRCVALIVDNNGQIILAGSLTQPLLVQTAKGSTGAKDTDKHGWDVEFRGIGAQASYFYTAALPAFDAV